MEEQNPLVNKQPATINNDHAFPAFNVLVVVMMLVVAASVIFLSLYRPSQIVPQPKITLEQKITHLETGVPLPGQETRPAVPWWMMAMIFGFIIIQTLPLVLAAHKTRSPELTRRDLRQIEFLTETPLFLGLLGSLLGVCMTHFLSGTLSAPLAYLTTISGILLFLFGRFTILASLPPSTDFTLE